MGTSLKVAISLVVASVGSLLTSATIIKGVSVYSLHMYARAQAMHYSGPPDYTPNWTSYIVPAAMLGSVVLSPILFCFCYHLLGIKHRTPKD